MNVGTLKKVIAAYLQVPVADTVIEGVDLALLALNNARKAAEQIHDWNCEQVMVYGDATDGVGSWMNMLSVEDDEAVTLKQPETFYLNEGDGVLVPLYHYGRKSGAVRAKERNAANPLSDGRWRYRDDTGAIRPYTLRTDRNAPYGVYVHGGGFELAPTPEGTTRIHTDGFRWLPDYTEDTDTDFFIQNSMSYMQWSGVVELNNLFQVYIPQQEGSLPPPVRARDDALTALIEYDKYIVESGRQPRR